MKLLNSITLPLGSFINIVDCSPISPLNLVYGETRKSKFIFANLLAKFFHSLSFNIIPKWRTGISLLSTEFTCSNVIESTTKWAEI